MCRLLTSTFASAFAGLLISASMAAAPQSPKALESPKPEYPKEALATGQEGTARVRITVLPSGSTSGAIVISSSGREDLDRAAIEAAKNWKFLPGRDADGNPVAVHVVIPFAFRVSARSSMANRLSLMHCDDFIKQLESEKSSAPERPLHEMALYRRTLTLVEQGANDQAARERATQTFEKSFLATLEQCTESPREYYLPKLLLLQVRSAP